MQKTLTHGYELLLWVLCAIALDSLFQSWWPWQQAFWSSAWTGGLVVAVLALVIVVPAVNALER